MAWVAAMALGGSLLAGPANAEFRWPWEKPDRGKKPVPTAAQPQPTAAAPQQQGSALPQEEAFLQKLHELNLEEIALGELAVRKAIDSDVKHYATMLVADHKQADATLKAHVQKMGWRLNEPAPRLHSPVIRLPGAPRSDLPAANAKVEKLEPLQGESFKREFFQTMVDGHDALIPELAAFKEQESDRAFHSELVKIFDSVKHHRKEAKRLLDASYGRKDVRGSDRDDVRGEDDDSRQRGKKKGHDKHEHDRD